MNCDYIKNNLDAFVDNELGDEQHEEFQNHLEQCPSCSALFNSYTDMIFGLNELGKIEFHVSDELHNKIMEGVKNADASYKPKKTSFSTNSQKYTLVAGLLTLFVATGSYQTYQYLQNDMLLDQPVIINTIPNENIDPSTEIEQIAPEVEVAEDNVSNDSTMQDLPLTDATLQSNSTLSPDTPVSSEPISQPQEKIQPITEEAQQPVQSPAQSPKVAAAPATQQASPLMAKASISPDVEIMLSNPEDIDDYLKYIESYGDLNISNIEKNGGEYLIHANTQDLNKFTNFVNNYNETTDNDVSISVLNESVEPNNGFTFILK